MPFSPVSQAVLTGVLRQGVILFTEAFWYPCHSQCSFKFECSIENDRSFKKFLQIVISDFYLLHIIIGTLSLVNTKVTINFLMKPSAKLKDTDLLYFFIYSELMRFNYTVLYWNEINQTTQMSTIKATTIVHWFHIVSRFLGKMCRLSILCFWKHTILLFVCS